MCVYIYIYTYIYFFPFPVLNISKDQNQKSMKTRKCTRLILISTFSPAFHSDVIWPYHTDLSIFMCFTQVFSSSSFLIVSPQSLPRLQESVRGGTAILSRNLMSLMVTTTPVGVTLPGQELPRLWLLHCLTLHFGHNRFHFPFLSRDWRSHQALAIQKMGSLSKPVIWSFGKQ